MYCCHFFKKQEKFWKVGVVNESLYVLISFVILELSLVVMDHGIP